MTVDTRAMRPRALPLLLSSMVLLSSGCSVSALLDKSNKEAEKTVDLICGKCGDLFPDFAQCEDLFGGRLVSDDECTVEALEVDDEASRETLNCLIDTQQDYNKCLASNVECTDANSWAVCQDIINKALVNCPQLPVDVQLALLKCV